MDEKVKAQAYQSWLGYYNGQPVVKMSQAELVARANNYGQQLGEGR